MLNRSEQIATPTDLLEVLAPNTFFGYSVVSGETINHAVQEKYPDLTLEVETDADYYDYTSRLDIHSHRICGVQILNTKVNKFVNIRAPQAGQLARVLEEVNRDAQSGEDFEEL